MFNLKVHNFRSFQNQNLEFSRINILIGENSGGKSSVLKLLLALKQTVEVATEVNLKLKGDYVDLGNFEEVVYYRNKSKRIKIGLGTKPTAYHHYFLSFLPTIELRAGVSKIQRIAKLIADFEQSVTYANFEFSSKLNDHTAIKTTFKNDRIGTLELVLSKGKDLTSVRSFGCTMKYKLKIASGEIHDCSISKEGFFSMVEGDFKSKLQKEYGKKAEEVFYSIAYLLVTQNYFSKKLEEIRFVNPIGTSPKRFYFQEDRKASYKLIDIEKFVNVLTDKTLGERLYSERMLLLNKIIKDFGIAEEISIIRDKQLPVLALNVRTKDLWTNITDVGYGVSLQIPILFQALLSEHYTRRGEVLLIEQPEVHLHPTLQAKFVETLLSIGNKNTYFIETHSEHIVRKLQILVKNKSFNLKPEDVTIHYFQRSSSAFKVSEHKISSNGNLTPAFPDGFFDTSYSLVKELL